MHFSNKIFEKTFITNLKYINNDSGIPFEKR
jgi:hypothetical protein